MSNYLVSPSPHIHDKASTSRIMGDVVLALMPAIIASVIFYGWSELLVLAVSAVSCVLIEFAITKWLMKKPGIFCGSAALVTGLLLAMNLPASTPWWMVVIGSLVAIGVAKMSFGGLGQNVFNPAITGRVFLLISFPQQMTDWTATPGFVARPDAISGATPLGLIKEGLSQGYTVPEILESNGLTIRTAIMDIGASAGELSSFLLLIGFGYLLLRKVVKPWIPLAIFATVAAISGIFNAVNPDIYTGPAFNLLTGGVVLGACFMATDYVTSPMSNLGGIIYGIGIGFIVMMIRYFGSYPEGMSFAILIMNMAVPLLNKWFHQKKFGRN